jgi:TetR/AcrR family transcriptional regulator, regulator of mycofactocin system
MRSTDGMTEMEGQSLAAQLRAKRSQLMVAELEAVALRLFDERGFDRVTVDEIASEAHISVRTFYRYFPAKEDVLQVNIDRRSDALRIALSRRPVDEPPLRTLRLALVEVVSAEDPAVLRRWIAVIAVTPSVLKSVLGGIQLKSQRVIMEFLATRLALPSDGVVPTMLAAAAGGVLQASLTSWFLRGGDVARTISEGFEVLERGIGAGPGTRSAEPSAEQLHKLAERSKNAMRT